MPTDYRDLMLEIQADVQEIVQEFAAELMEPQMMDALRMRWGTIPEDAKEMLKQQNPKMYRKLIQITTEG